MNRSPHVKHVVSGAAANRLKGFSGELRHV